MEGEATKPPADLIWFNGSLIPWDSAKVHVLAHALHYGASAFEGIRTYVPPSGPAVFCLKDHLQRLFLSCKILRMEMAYTPAALTEAILSLVQKNGLTDCYIRPVVFRGYRPPPRGLYTDPRNSPVEVAIAAFHWGLYFGREIPAEGIDVMVSSFRKPAPNTVPSMAKLAANYQVLEAMSMEAHDHGFRDSIALDSFGYVSEGGSSNLFLVHEGVVYTPPVHSALLPGVTRRVVMQLCEDLGLICRETVLPRDMLYIADEIFLTGTAAEITPVRSVDKLPVGGGRRGPITERLMEEFSAITSGRRPDRHGWMTPVPR